MDDYRLNIRHDDTPRITTPALAKGFVERRVRELSTEIGKEHVVLAFSGGVCSTVCAALLKQAIGDRLHSTFVDLGDKTRAAHVSELYYRQFSRKLEVMNASASIEGVLDGVSDPEERNRTIGVCLVEAYCDLAISHNTHLVGMATTYPDIVEAKRNRPSHHSTVHGPLGVGFEPVEPVKLLYKDEVQVISHALGLCV